MYRDLLETRGVPFPAHTFDEFAKYLTKIGDISVSLNLVRPTEFDAVNIGPLLPQLSAEKDEIKKTVRIQEPRVKKRVMETKLSVSGASKVASSVATEEEKKELLQRTLKNLPRSSGTQGEEDGGSTLRRSQTAGELSDHRTSKERELRGDTSYLSGTTKVVKEISPEVRLKKRIRTAKVKEAAPDFLADKDVGKGESEYISMTARNKMKKRALQEKMVRKHESEQTPRKSKRMTQALNIKGVKAGKKRAQASAERIAASKVRSNSKREDL